MRCKPYAPLHLTGNTRRPEFMLILGSSLTVIAIIAIVTFLLMPTALRDADGDP